MIGFTAGFSSRVEAAVESKAFGSPRRTAWRGRCCHTGGGMLAGRLAGSVSCGSVAKSWFHQCWAAVRA
eukprot:644953-Pleurochrysis_carterae.AAC.1